MTQWCGLQPVTTRTAMRIANVISADRIHFDRVTVMITLMTVFLIFMTLSFF